MKKIKLGEVLDVRRGTSLSGEYYADKGSYIRLTLGNFNYPNGGFKENTSKDNIFFIGYIKQEFIMNKGDIITPLTEQVSGLLGETATIPQSNKYIQSGDIGLVIPNEKKLDKRFGYYLISSPIVKKQLDASAQQTKIRHTSPNAIKNCEVWIPEDITEQAKIGKLLDSINDKISNNKAICSDLEEMAKLIYDYWFVQFDFPDENGKPYKSSGGKMIYNEELKREIPEGWEVKKIEDFCKIFTGKKDVNKSLDKGKYKFYSCAPEYRYSDEKLYEGNAILVSGNGSYTGRTIFISEAFDLYQRTYAIVNKIENDILYYIFYSMKKNFVPKVSGGTHGTAIPYIVFNDIAKEPILYNMKVINIFQEKIIPIQIKILNNQKENQDLASLRDFLLPMLMNGQVKVGNPSA